jgi:hypothetical protein
VILTAVVAAAPPRVVARRRPCLCVALSASIDDVVGVVVLGLPARINDPLPDRRSALVGWLPHRAARVDACLLALGAAVVSHTTLLAYADAELSACCTAACSMTTCASRYRFRASGIEGASMARSSVAAVMSFWLARSGVFGSSTLKLSLMRSRACLPSSCTRSPRAEPSAAIEVRSSRTTRYSFVSLDSSSRA